MLCRVKFSSSKKKNANHYVQCYHSSHCFPERSGSSTNTPDGGPLWMKGSSPGCSSMVFPTYSCILSTGSERPAVPELPSPHCRRFSCYLYKLHQRVKYCTLDILLAPRSAFYSFTSSAKAVTMKYDEFQMCYITGLLYSTKVS